MVKAIRFLRPLVVLLAMVGGGGPMLFAQVEGYGVGATGGTGKPTCIVSTSMDQCFFGGGVQVSDRSIVFSAPIVDGPTNNSYIRNNVTIDGCANGQNGVTIRQSATGKRGLVIEGPVANVIVRCLRFQGADGGKQPGAGTEFDLLSLDGADGLVSRVLIDRCTFIGSTDGSLDITSNVQDVTVQRSLFYGTPLNQLIKYDTRQRISLHHNVYTMNGERNPQIKGDARNIDFVSNVIHNNTITRDSDGNTFSPYGTRLWNANSSSDSPGNVTGNFVANAWIGANAGLSIDTESGASAAGIYLSGNYCNPGPCPGSPASSPQAVPPANAVTATQPALMRTQMLPGVGSPNRTATDQARIDAVAAALPAVCTPVSTPQVSVADQVVSEGDSGMTLMVLTVSLSAASTCPTTVNFASAAVTATAGVDYDNVAGSLTFPVGSTSQTIVVGIHGDRVFESDETFLLNLSSPVAATLGDSQATATIANDDSPGFSIDDVSVVEPPSGTTTAAFTVTLAPTSGAATSVDYATAPGTATAPGDFSATSGKLNFAAGVATQPLSVVIVGDGVKEGVQTFLVNLSNPTGGAAIGASQATGSIFDPGAFASLPPCRVADTRTAAPLGANSVRNFVLLGSCGIPVGARAVALNITVTAATAPGDLRVFPAGVALPLASAINYGANQTRANNLIMNLGSGQLSVRCDQASGSVHLIIDVAGYFL